VTFLIVRDFVLKIPIILLKKIALIFKKFKDLDFLFKKKLFKSFYKYSLRQISIHLSTLFLNYRKNPKNYVDRAEHPVSMI